MSYRLDDVYFLKPFVPITDDAVFPLLSAVDLIGSSLIQHVL